MQNKDLISSKEQNNIIKIGNLSINSRVIAAPLAGQRPHRPVRNDLSVLPKTVAAGPYPSFPDQILDEAVQVIQT